MFPSLSCEHVVMGTVRSQASVGSPQGQCWSRQAHVPIAPEQTSGMGWHGAPPGPGGGVGGGPELFMRQRSPLRQTSLPQGKLSLGMGLISIPPVPVAPLFPLVVLPPPTPVVPPVPAVLVAPVVPVDTVELHAARGAAAKSMAITTRRMGALYHAAATTGWKWTPAARPTILRARDQGLLRCLKSAGGEPEPE